LFTHVMTSNGPVAERTPADHENVVAPASFDPYPARFAVS
jgi:hypothetical protein